MSQKIIVHKSYLVALVLCFLLSLAWYSERDRREDKFTVVVELGLPAAAEYVELFYDDGAGYVAGKSIVLPVVAGIELYEFTFPKNFGAIRVRLDPGNVSGDVELRSLSFYSLDKELIYSGQLLHEKLRILNQIEYSGARENILLYRATGPDPYLDLEVPVSSLEVKSFRPLLTTLVLFIVLFAIFVGLIWLFRRRNFQKKFNRLVLSAEMFFENKVNQPELIVFGRGSIFFIAFLFVLTVVLISFKINQSSFPMYDAYFPSDVKSNILSGEARGIRSDEWVVQTPYILSQVINNNPWENPSIGPGATTSLTAVPVNGLINVMQPKFWGFVLLDVERGFSWLWTYKSVGFLLTGFLFFMLITRSNTAVSIIGALAIYSSNFSQWWFSSNYPEIVIAFFGIVISALYVMLSDHRYLVLFSAIAFAIFSVNFLLHLYPPFLVPLFYLGLFTVGGFLLSEERYTKIFTFFAFRLIVACCGLLALGAFSAYWYVSAAETIEVVTNTVYPGRRITTGGGEGWGIFTGYFDLFSFDDRRFPTFLGNVCEASRFYLFAPLVMLFFLFKRSRKSMFDPLIISLLLYIALLVVWSIFGFPELIARYSLWSMSHPKRAYLGLGFANIMLFCIVLSTLLRHKIQPIAFFAIASVSLVLCLMLGYYGISMAEMDSEYYSSKRIAISILILFMLIISLLRLNLRLIIGLFLLMSIQGFRVNPLIVGLDGIYKKEVAVEAAAFNEANPGRWAVFGSFVHPQYFKALGMSVFNGVIFTPNVAEMELLDVDHQYDFIWNRYAHINMVANPELESPLFTLVQPDLFTITIDPCAEEMRALGIVYLVFTYNADALISRCARSLTPKPINGVYIYEMDFPKNL